MRLLFILICLLSSSRCFADKQLDDLYHSIYRLDEALLNRDTVTLKALLDEDVRYGHSNGWVERKQDMIHDLYNGKLIYKEINQGSKPFVTINGNAGRVLVELNVKVVVDGTALSTKLNVIQFWIYEHKVWKLWGRQSVKVA